MGKLETLADDLQGFIARIQAPVVTDAEVFATLGSPDGERGLIERLRDLSHEFSNLSATAGESHYGRRAQRFAHSLDLVVEQLSEIHRTAGSRVAGYVRDRLVSLDADGDDDQLAHDVRDAAARLHDPLSPARAPLSGRSRSPCRCLGSAWPACG